MRIISKLPCAGRFCLAFLFISLIIFSDVSAEAQSARKRRVAPETKSTALRKHAVKPKPLTANDHREAEQRLSDLGYWTGPIDGKWDQVSHQALIAFQKVEGLKRTGQLKRADFEVLMNSTRPTPLETGAEHIEVDLIRQVLFLVDDTGTVIKILPVSTGSGKMFVSQGWARDALTHPGRYNVYLKLPGWKKSPLGRLYYPIYFMVGTAIHGYPSVPSKPASHGCIRIPMFAAKEMYNTIPLGMRVIVHKDDMLNPAMPEVNQKDR